MSNERDAAGDESGFYTGASRQDFLFRLQAHGNRGGVAVLEGDAGSGVSLMLAHLAEGAAPTVQLLRIDGEQEHGSGLVVDALLAHFGIERVQLAQVLRETLAEGSLAVVVDNTESLVDGALATMAALKEKLGVRLAFIFAGAPGIAEKVTSAGLLVDEVLDLPALSAAEVQDFARQQRGLSLTAEQAEQLCQQSHGQPGPLLALLSQQAAALAAASAEDEAQQAPPWPTDSEIVEDGPAAPPPAVEPDFEAEPEVDAGVAETDEEEDEHWAAGPVLGSLDDTEEVASDYADEEWIEDEAAPVAASPGRAGGLRPLLIGLAVIVLLLLLWLLLRTGNDAAEQPRTLALPPPPAREAVQATPEVAPAGPRQREMEPVARLEDLPARSQPTEEQADQDEAGTVQVEAVREPRLQSSAPASGTTAASGYRGADWLRGLADERWFLQITATSQEQAAQQLLDDLDGKGAYYQGRRNEKLVYLVLAGDYGSREAALTARDALPEHLRSGGPFPRQMADIRGEL